MQGEIVYMTRNKKLTASQVFAEFVRITFTDPPRQVGPKKGSFFTLVEGRRTYTVEFEKYGQYWAVCVAEENGAYKKERK